MNPVLRIEEVIRRPSVWMDRRPGAGIVVSSRARLARNLKGECFPGCAREEDRARVWARLGAVVSSLPSMRPASGVDMGDLGWADKHVLKERCLISPEHSERGKGSGLVLSEDASLSVMVNEEDHLRMQALSPGLDLEGVWARVDRLDTELSEQVPLAFSRRLGYLTSCPSNVGTGLRASVMMHLPALNLLNEMDPSIRGLTRIGLAVRGLLGEGTEASGNMFQVSNQVTLGETEESIVRNLQDVVVEMVRHEENARERLVEQRPLQVRDYVGRAYGVLLNARLLSSREMMDLLSALRLGVDLGLVRNLAPLVLYELMLWTQPGHMQVMRRRELTSEERDQTRAEIVREKIRRVVVDA